MQEYFASNKKNNEFILSVSVPFGSSATIVLPGSNKKQTVKCGEYTFKTAI